MIHCLQYIISDLNKSLESLCHWKISDQKQENQRDLKHRFPVLFEVACQASGLKQRLCTGDINTSVNAQPSHSPASKCFITAKAWTQFCSLYAPTHKQARSLKGKVKHDKLK